MFHLAFGYFLSYLPYALLANALSSGMRGRKIYTYSLVALGLSLLAVASLRAGFTTFLAISGALQAVGVGVFCEMLFILGALTYLDVRGYSGCVRGYSWCVPVNRPSTLFSGMAASYLPVAMAGVAPPGSGPLIAVVFIVGAVAALSCPALRSSLGGTASPERMVLSVVTRQAVRMRPTEQFA